MSLLDPSTDPSQFGIDMAALVISICTPLVYASGSLTYVGTATATDFDLPANGTAASAADKISTGIYNWWGTDSVVGIVGVPTNGGLSVISGTIDCSSVKSTIQTALYAHFVTGNQTKQGTINVINNAINSAIATIVTTHTEMMPGPPPYPSSPFYGGAI